MSLLLLYVNDGNDIGGNNDGNVDGVSNDDGDKDEGNGDVELGAAAKGRWSLPSYVYDLPTSHLLPTMMIIQMFCKLVS